MNIPKRIYPGNKLTVIIRNDGPMFHCDDVPSYRSVQIELTKEQVEKLALNLTHGTKNNNFYENISNCFIEPKAALSAVEGE